MGKRGLTIVLLAAMLLPMVVGVQPIRAADDPIINEFVFNHTGTDTEAFIEVFGDASSDYSGFTLLEIEGDDGGAGTIDAAIPVGTTDADGFWIDDEDVENGTVTLLLVEGFTGSVGTDLDSDDDGTLDSEPWTRVVDDVAVHDAGDSDYTYATTVLTPDYDGGSYPVGGASRIPNGTDTDSGDDWVRNDFDGAGFEGFTGTPGAGEALNTPGATNQLVPDVPPPPVPEVSINEIQYTEDPSGDSPYTGQQVTTEGVVTAAFYNGYFIGESGGGPWSGLWVYDYANTPALGDRLRLSGTVDEYDGLTELTDITAYDIESSGNPLPTPEILPTGDVSQEQWESVLVRVENVTVTDNDLGYGEWEVDDGSGPAVVDDIGSYTYSPANGDELDFVQGPLNYTYSAFKIAAQDDGDIGVDVPPAPTPGPDPEAPELLLTEIVVTPTDGEFVEIYNPTDAAIDLSNVYLTDATFAGGETYYYNIVTGSNAGGGGFADFHARFPDGATIAAGEYQTIALNGSGNFFTEFGINPTYELYEDGDAADDIPDMREALPGSINDQGGLTNDGEVVVLYYWDGESDLVTDLDYVVWGDKAEAVDKTGVAIDGPDADDAPSAYLDDTPIASQDIVAGGPHAYGNSWQRWDLSEGDEIETGGNGVGGNDETSEDVSNTWCEDGPSPGAESVCEPMLTGECGDEATLISEVQGDGLTSPLVGEQVIVEAIVVGDFQWGGDDDGDLGGFFVQEETNDQDGDPMTSEGVFVYDGTFGVDVAVGDRVRINGVASEYYDLTQIGSLSDVIVCDQGSVDRVTPGEVTLPVEKVTDLEPYEGMSVVIGQPLYISEFYNFDRYGEIVLTTDRQFQPTAIYEPGSPDAAALAEQNRLSRIQLEDGRTSQNPDPAIHPNGGEFTLSNRFRGGDIVQNVTGVLSYGFGEYEIHPTAGAEYTAVNERSAVPDVGGNITAASFNVLNYFTTLDTGVDICGPTGGQECRGADNENEFERQQAKIVAAMCAIDADVFGLMELENTNPDNDPEPGDGISNYVLKSLVGALNADDSPCPDKTYAFTDDPATGEDAIQQGIIYKESTVTPLGKAVLDDSAFTDPNNLGEEKNRPAIAETFMDNETGGVFTAVVNHLKSKGSPCGAGDDDPEQGNCNLTRTLAAQKLVDWLEEDPTGSGDPDFLILGDLNAYDKEDPIDALKANGYTDLLYEHAGEYAYSYVFDGQLGYLDYGMPNEALLPQVTSATAWHINADEPDILDYDTTFKKDAQDALYEANAYRSSDHDPVIVGLNLICTDLTPPTLEVTVSPDTLWPPNHKYVTVVPTIDVSDNVDPHPTVTLVSVESNEPDEGLGDGDMPHDIVINEDGTIDLRAERSGTGDGRIYTITYIATDACGNSTEAVATVLVPFDQRSAR